MASLSNDLESLSLDLPDLVTSTSAGNKQPQIVTSGSAQQSRTPTTSRKGRGHRNSKRGSAASKHLPKVPEDGLASRESKGHDDLELLGACALIQDDQRVPDLGNLVPNLEYEDNLGKFVN